LVHSAIGFLNAWRARVRPRAHGLAGASGTTVARDIEYDITPGTELIVFGDVRTHRLGWNITRAVHLPCSRSRKPNEIQATTGRRELPAMTTRLPLSLAIGDYEHTRDLTFGRIQPEGIELIPSFLPPEEVFHRVAEWDIVELSMGMYSSMVAHGNPGLTAIPVFVSRVFRHSMFYVREGSGLEAPSQLAGARIGVPEWAQTAGIYGRGMLQHDAGLDLAAVEWVQAGLNEAGRSEKVELKLPSGIRVRRAPDKTLNEMLLAGELDAVMSARPPAAFGQGIVRLYRDPAKAERDYFERTGIFPIMHVVVVRTELLERHPWVAMNLFSAFEAAKQRSYARLRDITAASLPFAWIPQQAESMRQLFGDDFWPYGLEPNRTTLSTFLRFAHEQGTCSRLLAPEDLFAPSTLAAVRV
jgi:4,5-dihydroxyphthalate decarboxylase